MIRYVRSATRAICSLILGIEGCEFNLKSSVSISVVCFVIKV